MALPSMKAVFSGVASHVGHDPETQELHVKWQDGKTSIYSGVPRDVADSVSTSWSVGKAIHAQIKGKFPHRYGE